MADDVVRIQQGGREILLVGTAHISQESIETVRRVIAEEAPDTVCVELDAQRYKALRDKKWWESMNLFEVIRKGQAPFLLANLALSSYQKRMGLATGVKPGSELAAAAQEAEERNMKVELVDRNIRTTLLRAWRKTSFWRKSLVLSSLLSSVFVGERTELNEEEMRRLRQQDVLTGMLDEMAEVMPSIKEVLVDERDLYMAGRIQRAQGKKVVAVVGAAHMPGITRRIQEDIQEQQLSDVDHIPEKSFLSRAIPWLVPAIVIGLFVVGFLYGDTQKVKEAAVAWVLANGLLSALGALLALGHPLTILSAFVAAPITSLNPTIGAGFVTALVQTWATPPSVADMERVSDDIASLKGWWTNRVARVLLVFLLSSIGSSIGTFAAFGWLKDLL